MIICSSMRIFEKMICIANHISVIQCAPHGSCPLNLAHRMYVRVFCRVSAFASGNWSEKRKHTTLNVCACTHSKEDLKLLIIVGVINCRVLISVITYIHTLTRTHARTWLTLIPAANVTFQKNVKLDSKSYNFILKNRRKMTKSVL